MSVIGGKKKEYEKMSGPIDLYDTACGPHMREYNMAHILTTLVTSHWAEIGFGAPAIILGVLDKLVFFSGH
jgi:hypothetical protein